MWKRYLLLELHVDFTDVIRDRTCSNIMLSLTKRTGLGSRILTQSSQVGAKLFNKYARGAKREAGLLLEVGFIDALAHMFFIFWMHEMSST